MAPCMTGSQFFFGALWACVLFPTPALVALVAFVAYVALVG